MVLLYYAVQDNKIKTYMLRYIYYNYKSCVCKII